MIDWEKVELKIREEIKLYDYNDLFDYDRLQVNITRYIKSLITKEFKLVASGKIEDVGKPTVGLYKNNKIQTVDISKYKGKIISIYISENKDVK